MVVTILLCVAVIITGGVLGRATGWVVLGLGVLALLLAMGAHFRIGF